MVELPTGLPSAHCYNYTGLQVGDHQAANNMLWRLVQGLKASIDDVGSNQVVQVGKNKLLLPRQ